MSGEDLCPCCGEPVLDVEIAVEGGRVGPVPEGAEDLCLHIVVAPVPGAVVVWHDHEVQDGSPGFHERYEGRRIVDSVAAGEMSPEQAMDRLEELASGPASSDGGDGDRDV